MFAKSIRRLPISAFAILSCFCTQFSVAEDSKAVDAMIDISKFHADDQFDQITDGGILMAFSADDQKWLNQQVDQTRSKLHDYYSKLKQTHEPAARYNEQDVYDTSDAVPYNLNVSLETQRNDLKAVLEPGFRHCSNLFDMAVMSPDPLGYWFLKLKLPEATITKLTDGIAAEVKLVDDEGAKASLAKNTDPETLKFYERRATARHNIVHLIADALTADQRKSLAAMMEEQDSRFLIADSLQRRMFRDERKWAKFEIPPSALSNSDSALSNPLIADQRISLVRSEDKKIIATVDAKEGQMPGFTTDAFHGGLAASLDDQEVAIDPGKYVYYWIKADAKAPLVALPVIPPFAATQP